MYILVFFFQRKTPDLSWEIERRRQGAGEAGEWAAKLVCVPAIDLLHAASGWLGSRAFEPGEKKTVSLRMDGTCIMCEVPVIIIERPAQEKYYDHRYV